MYGAPGGTAWYAAPAPQCTFGLAEARGLELDVLSSGALSPFLGAERTPICPVLCPRVLKPIRAEALRRVCLAEEGRGKGKRCRGVVVRTFAERTLLLPGS